MADQLKTKKGVLRGHPLFVLAAQKAVHDAGLPDVSASLVLSDHLARELID